MSQTDNLDYLLDKLSITKADFAKLMKVRPNTVSEWCKSSPPESVLLYLGLLIEVRNLGRINK